MNFNSFAEELYLIKQATNTNWAKKIRLPVAVGITGVTGLAAAKALGTQTPYDLAVADRYNQSMQQLPPAGPGRWMDYT